jgi:Xaa-Pro aminopeptidase
LTYSAEIQTKLDRVRALMDTHHVDTLWLRRVENVAWITGGIDVAINTADILGVASVVITANTCTVWTNTIEAPRLQNEDRIEERGLALHVVPWEAPPETPPGRALGVDFPMPGAADLTGDLIQLRVRLLPVEQDRFRQLGHGCAEAMQHAANRVRPGNTEAEIGAALAYETAIRNIRPTVVLVATDERIHHFRHPLPTPKIMEHYAMLVLCGRRDGLVCSVTRLVHFGPLPDDLRRRMEATAQVDAAVIAASKPGVSLEAVFKAAQDAYARAGFDGEWKLHHQGGLAGYTPRDVLAVPGEQTRLEPGMVCAWNPSITGTKSEDSILVPQPGEPPEILTRMYGWPCRSITVDGLTLERPLIMEL